MNLEPKTEIFETETPDQTHQLGIQIASKLSPGYCVSMSGGLGAGKTALTRGIAEGLGADSRLVSSPTYVLVNEYPLPDSELFIFHLDLFRMNEPTTELQDIGLDEMRNEGIVITEWADMASNMLVPPCIKIAIDITGMVSRKFTLQFID